MVGTGCGVSSGNFFGDDMEIRLQAGESVVFDVIATADGRNALDGVSFGVGVHDDVLEGPVEVFVLCGEAARRGTLGDETIEWEAPGVDVEDESFPVRAECSVAFSADDGASGGGGIVWFAWLYLEYRSGGHHNSEGDFEIHRR